MRQIYSIYPPAYQLTIRCYGTRLHGCAQGSVSRYQNEYGAPRIKPDEDLLETMRRRMKQKPYSLDQQKRSIVRDSVIEVCRYRKWSLFALHIGTNHLHSIVGAALPPEPVMDDFKEYSSRNLNLARIDPEKRRRWARHGSTEYIWTRERFLGALKYVLYEQGCWMEVYVDSKLIKEEFGIDLPPDLTGVQRWFEDIGKYL